MTKIQKNIVIATSIVTLLIGILSLINKFTDTFDRFFPYKSKEISIEK